VNRELPPELLDDAIARAVGDELRRVREARGLSRLEFVAMLPSGIGDRTVLSYEHGTRQLTLLRLAELSWVLDVDAPLVYSRGIQRARILTEKLTLAVDLKAFLRDERMQFKPLAQWAKNLLNKHPNDVVELEPVVVQHLASSIGCTHSELSTHLARFTPDIPVERWEVETAS
jgi:transcriptional regulator with XRE-family HTH domain